MDYDYVSYAGLSLEEAGKARQCGTCRVIDKWQNGEQLYPGLKYDQNKGWIDYV